MRSTEKSNNLIGIRNRDLPACITDLKASQGNQTISVVDIIFWGCGLLYVVLNSQDRSSSNDKLTDELERIWKAALV
jgi:hypothetical protein